MQTTAKLILALLATSALAGCMASFQPQPTAYQKNIGPGSSVTGVPTSAEGEGRPGDMAVPGVSTGRSLTR